MNMARLFIPKDILQGAIKAGTELPVFGVFRPQEQLIQVFRSGSPGEDGLRQIGVLSAQPGVTGGRNVELPVDGTVAQIGRASCRERV